LKIVAESASFGSSNNVSRYSIVIDRGMSMKNDFPDDLPDVTIVTDTDSFSFPQKEADACYLVMIYGEFLGRRFSITNEPFVVGRSAESSIQLADDCISRLHCRVISKTGGAVITDLDSTNGTYVNGTAVASRPLKDGDRVKVGRSIFKFLSGDNIEHAYHEEIYRLKTTDGLTGAFNKRFFLEELEREVYRFMRYGRPLSLLMLDIDHFKRVNDDYGHLAGDRVLSQLGTLLSTNIGREDVFCRYGGEEFTVLMPEKEFTEAMDLAERLRKLVSEAHFDFDGIDLPVTISVGGALANSSMKSHDDLVALADARLYEAKNNGRNRVEPQDFDPSSP
jgi:diguanylate cyclase (GGDEF)-like protein